MPWLYRKTEQHVCKKPTLESAHVGDLWRCDNAKCRAMWTVRASYDDKNVYFALVPSHREEYELGRLGLLDPDSVSDLSE